MAGSTDLKITDMQFCVGAGIKAEPPGNTVPVQKKAWKNEDALFWLQNRSAPIWLGSFTEYFGSVEGPLLRSWLVKEGYIKEFGNREPCNHKGCQRHVTHPCECCKRTGAEGAIILRVDKDFG